MKNSYEKKKKILINLEKGRRVVADETMFRYRHLLYKSRPIILNTLTQTSSIRLLSKKPFFEETCSYQERSIPEKISQYFTDILINEGQKIADEPIHAFIEQVPKLSEELKKCLDQENKLFTILSYDPILIDPRLYLHFINDEIPKNMKRVYFERLLYHRCYAACWNHFSENYDTLSDLDDFLELINSILLQQDNYQFAILDFVLSLPLQLNENFHNQIIDSLVYTIKPEFDTSHVLEIWKLMNEINTIDELTSYHHGLEKSFENDTLYLKRLMELLKSEDNLKHQTIVEYLVNFQNITSRCGWINLIFPQFESSTVISNLYAPEYILPFISSLNYLINHQAKLNELDTLYILHGGVIKPYSIFTGYTRTVTTLNKPIINHLTRALLNKPNELMTIYKPTAVLLDKNLLIEVLDVLLPLQVDVYALLRIHTPETQEMVLEYFLKKFTCEQVYSMIIPFSRTRMISRKLITCLTTRHSPTADQLVYLASKITSKYTILELNRSTLLRAGIIDETFTTTVFNFLIKTTLPKVQQNGDFNQQFQFSSDRKIFHNTMRAYCQTLSLLNPSQLNGIMSIISRYMDSNSFYYTQDRKAKEYLLKLLHRETFQFIKRRLSPKELVLYVNSLVEFNSKSIWFKHWLFKSIVLEDFKQSLQLLELPAIKNYLTPIVSGIIDNKSLKGINRLLFLLMFFDKIKEKGLKYTMKQRECYQLVNICLKEDKGEDVKRMLVKVFSTNDRNFKRVLKEIGRSDKFNKKLQ